MLILICAASLLSTFGTVAASALLLVAPARLRTTAIPWLLAYAVGTLLAAAFLGLLPHALESAPAASVLPAMLGGMVLFFALEKLVLWGHRYPIAGDAGSVRGAAGPLIVVGDALHNFVDGVVLAGAFLTAPPLGAAATAAVIAHELPQELGDVAILLDSGYSRRRALGLNALSGLASLAGAVVAWLTLETARAGLPYVLALSAASFVYIAAADLVPGLHRRVGVPAGLAQVAMVGAGIATVVSLERLPH